MSQKSCCSLAVLYAQCSTSAGFRPGSSSPLVDRLLEAHGVVLGKTRMHELAVGVTTINMHGGPVLNPYNNVMHTGGPCMTPSTLQCMKEAISPSMLLLHPLKRRCAPPLSLSRAAISGSA